MKFSICNFQCFSVFPGLLLCFLLEALPAFAEVSFVTGVDRDTITVGDPITFRVRVRRGADDRVEVLTEKGFPGPFDLREARPPSVREVDGGEVEETRDFPMTAYRTGAFEIPPLTLLFRTAAGDTGRVRSDPVPVVVRSVKPEGVSDVRDIRSPVEKPAQIPPRVWIAAAALALAAAGAIWYLRRRARRPVEEPPPPPIDWFAELEKVARMGLLEKGDYKPYYSLLSDLFRRYLESRVGVEAMERTTFEIARDLRQGPLREEKVLDIEGFLSEADLVKFAKFSPPHETASRAVDRVRGLMEGMDAEPLPRFGSGEDAGEAPPAGVAG